MDSLGSLLARPLTSIERSVLLAIIIAIPAAANYRGTRTGSSLNNITTASKLVPLVFVVLFGVAHLVQHGHVSHVPATVASGLSNWMRALIFVVFAYGGWEDSLIPSGEITRPRRTIPFGLAVGLIVCAAIYILVQSITVMTIGVSSSATAVQETASVLLGRFGGVLVQVAVLISTYGWVAAAMLFGPRIAYSLAAQDDFPALFARVHPRFHTPSMAILFYAFAGWILAASGAFLWLVAVSAGTMTATYLANCASLWRLRQVQPNAKALRIPFGRGFSVVGMLISLAFMSGLKLSEVFLMGVTGLIASANWWWGTRRHKPVARETLDYRQAAHS